MLQIVEKNRLRRVDFPSELRYIQGLNRGLSHVAIWNDPSIIIQGVEELRLPPELRHPPTQICS